MLDSIEAWNPRAFELSDNQKVEGFHEVKKAELRIRMEAALGRAPPLQGGPLLLPDVSMGMTSLLHKRCCGEAPRLTMSSGSRCGLMAVSA